MVDKAAEAMAKAMGAKLVTEEPNKDITNPNEGSEGTEGQEGQEAVGGTDGADGAEGTEGQEGTDNGNDGNEGSSSESQDDSRADSPDQGESKIIVPGAQDQDAQGTDQGKDFETLLAERSNGRFNNLSDIEKALEETPEGTFANKQIETLNTYVKQGGSFDDFMKTQTVDYSTMSPDQLVKEHIMMTEGLTSEEADLMIESDFGVPGTATEREKQIATINLKRQANKALDYLSDNQRKWAVPQGADQKAQQEAIDQKWQADLGSAVTSVENIEVALNQTDKFSFKVEGDVKEKIKETLKRPQAFFQRYVNPDGSENIKKFVEDMVWLEKREEIVRSAASNNKAKGKQEVIDGIKNPDFKGGNKGGQERAPKTIAQQAAEAMYGRK